MGFEGYLFRNDAVYGSSGYRFNFNYNVSQNSFMVANGPIWTVIFYLVNIVE